MSEDRRQSMPILYTRGTHFEVGLDIVSPISLKVPQDSQMDPMLLFQGRTFRSCIENYLGQNKHLNDVLVEKYQSAKVRRVYESTLKTTAKMFPQYIDELKGIAQGARVPFFQVRHVANTVRRRKGTFTPSRGQEKGHPLAEKGWKTRRDKVQALLLFLYGRFTLSFCKWMAFSCFVV